jgi:hypothetical protein
MRPFPAARQAVVAWHQCRWFVKQPRRGPLVSPRAADGCIAPMIRKPLGATTTLPVALLLP